MVLDTPPATETIAKHETLIHEYLSTVNQPLIGPIILHNYGANKLVYRIQTTNGVVTAHAASRDKAHELLEEYVTLSHLFRNASEFFPKPHAHFRSPSNLGDLLVMDFLPYDNFQDFSPKSCEIRNFRRVFAWQLGHDIAVIQNKTGMYPSEPHNKNILVENNHNWPRLYFVDAAQFRQGTLEDAARAIMANKEERRDAFAFILQFREGLTQGIVETSATTYLDAYQSLEFLKEYNDIFSGVADPKAHQMELFEGR